jgi:alkylhydroperoxidase/carboxymuconolactone decarboxylase family protein YurZ
MNRKTPLDARQQAIVTISAFTTVGDAERLKQALNEGLDAGLTVNEVKEILVQLYAYAGFPRSLGGIWTFMSVMDDRRAKGITDEEGRDASPVPADLDRDACGARMRADLSGLKEIPAEEAPYQKFAPIIDTFLKEHLFADIFARDILTYQERELRPSPAWPVWAGRRVRSIFIWARP